MRYADWVLLDIDGVQRGEVYLEITYYSNASSATDSSCTGSGANTSGSYPRTFGRRSAEEKAVEIPRC